LKASSWREYTTPEGKKYYSNIKTKETVWEVPPEIKEQLEKARKIANEMKNIPTPPIVPAKPSTPSVVQLEQPIPEFDTKEEAEKAFFSLLKETGVKSDWTWDQAMRAIITKPLYRALKTIVERKAAFQAYVDAESKREREEKEEFERQQKQSFMALIDRYKEMVKPYTRYSTFAHLASHDPAFNTIKSDKQREAYFEEYVQNMQRAEKDKLRDLRKNSMERFGQLLRSIPDITYRTQWKEAQSLYMEPNHDLKQEFQGMDMLDFLSVFEEYNRALWEEPLNELNKKMTNRKRRERKAREGYRELMQELVANHKINVRTMWKDIYPIIKDDPRYLEAVGLPESTPLDMFWDVIDDLDEQLYQQKKLVYDALKRADFDVTLETSLDDYLKVLDESVTSEVNQENLVFIFEHLQLKAEHRLKEEKRRQEKKQKKRMDILRHALKRLQPPIQLDDTWENVKSRVEEMEEYKELNEPALAQEAFEKFMKRLREKIEEEEDEEGMIKEGEDEDEHRSMGSHRRKRRDYSVSDGEERARRKRTMKQSGYGSSTEEGEALDAYVKKRM
jgi:pre-mRNA-processing factor 40